MRAIFIDATAQTVTDIDLPPGLAALRQQLGCRFVDRIAFDDRNDLWLDDEGLLSDSFPPMFWFSRYPSVLAGNAVICGYTDEGETIGTRLRADQVRPLIEFLDVVIDDHPR